LQKNTGRDTGVTANLQVQIKAKLLNPKDSGATLEKVTKENAKKLLDVLNSPDRQSLREQHKFTLEALSKDKGISIYDCQNLQSYAKVLYE
jgi:hypothetical protein